MISARSPQSRAGSVWRTFSAVVVVAVAFSLLYFGVLRLSADQERDEIATDLASRTSLAVRNMEVRLDAAATDVLLAASAPDVRRVAGADSAESRDSLAALFTAFASAKDAVMSMRYVDVDGFERVYVQVHDGETVRVPDAELVRVGETERAYSAQLQQGRLMVSPFDVRRVGDGVHGAVMTPMQPIVVLATGVFDGDRRQGTVVVSLDGSFLVEQLRASVGDVESFMLGADGGWLSAADEERSWSTARGLPGFADVHPDVWAAMRGDSGMAISDAGAYAFATAIPSHVGVRLGNDPDHEVVDHEHPDAWKVVAAIPAAQLPSAGLDRSPFVAIGYFSALAVIIATVIVLSRLLEGRRELRRSVRDSAIRLAAIRDTLGEGLIVVDQSGCIVDANPESERLLGWSREEMLDQNFHGLVHDHSDGAVPAEECAVLEASRAGVTLRSDDEVFQRSDGSGFHVGTSAAPLIVDGVVEGAVIVFRDITEIRRYQEEIRRLAYRDELTGLPNRRVFSDRLELAIGSADRRSAPVAVMFLDLDGFKGVNDDYGHVVGDEFLRQIARRIRESMRSSDTLARHGGDEFVVLLPEIEGREEAEVVARRIIDGLEASFVVDGYQLRAATSIGIALRMDGESADALVANADAAMYAAKQMGPNRYCVSGRAPQVAP